MVAGDMKPLVNDELWVPVTPSFPPRHPSPGVVDRASPIGRRRPRIRRRMARKGIDPSERLGRHRWVIERTLAWLNRYRRLTVRYERRADIHQAFLTLGCALICFNALQKRF